ncbi:hypothetical protein GOV14_00115 [Candidatus Pacearchaeota archaeon]|nr:hypothetical protein [Candidatus Pacearchaeota archaeon]
MIPRYFSGVDIGSEFMHCATLDENGLLVAAPKSVMHFGDPGKSLQGSLKILKESGINEDNTQFAFTGNVGKIFAKSTNSKYYPDTLTVPGGAHYLSPSSSYVFHIGAKDPYFFEVGTINNEELFVPDDGTGTKCGGGSGILLTKQCRRFFDNIIQNSCSPQERLEKMYDAAEKTAKEYKNDIDVGGRCGVVIQSDMIHLQNSGVSMQDILMGLFSRVAKNYISDVIRVRNLDKKKTAVVTGGVGFNSLVVERLQKYANLNIDLPQNHEKAGAIGAALRVKGSELEKKVSFAHLGSIKSKQRDELLYAPALKDSLPLINLFKESGSYKHGDLNVFQSPIVKFPVVFGIDGGSTTTKAVILGAENLDYIAEICIETNGRPLHAAQNVFRQIKDYFGDKLDVQAACYTGSSGAFYKKLFSPNKNGESLDTVVDEITCHATGVRNFDNTVDTIFELGGQDAKFTLFDKSGRVVKKAKMNLSCMAGTGQTMQNMIQMIGLDFKSYEELALKAEKTPVVDDTCGVFTEAGIAKLVSLGLPKSEVAAGVAYGFIGGYVNKFVGNESFGDSISAQGGPFNGLANLAALAAHTNTKINAFPHRQLFGAYGAALQAHEQLKNG